MLLEGKRKNSCKLSRQPTYQDLTEIIGTMPKSPSLSSLSSSSSSTCHSCRHLRNKPTPPVRAPLLDIRNVANSKLKWISTSPKPSVLPPKPVVVVRSSRPAKICSRRLRPARGVFDGFAVSVLKSGTTVLERLNRLSGHDSRPSIREVVQVSADGESVTTAKLRNQTVYFDNTRPITIDKLVQRQLGSIDVHTFSYDTLPMHLYGRYRCAANFVNILRSKTPKVTINKTVQGKLVTCCLMESLVDCTVAFSLPDDNAHFVQIGNDSSSPEPNQPSVTVTFTAEQITRLQAGDALLTLDGSKDIHSLPKPLEELVTIAAKMRQTALTVEKSVTSLQGVANFPVECGQRRAVH